VGESHPWDEARDHPRAGPLPRVEGRLSRREDRSLRGLDRRGRPSGSTASHLVGDHPGLRPNALTFAVELLAGWVQVIGHLDPGALRRAAGIGLLYSLVKVVCVGLYEEWTSRGLVLRNLADGL